MKHVFIDLETTGVNPNENAIIQIAGRLFEDDHELASFNYDVRPLPGQLLDLSALKIINKTSEELQTYPPALEVHKDFKDLLSQFIDPFDKTDKAVFLAYNAKFDFDFLYQWFNLCGDKYFGSFFWTPPICVMMLAMHVFQEHRAALPNFKLETVCKFAGCKFDSSEAHNALYDIDKTIELYQTLPNFL